MMHSRTCSYNVNLFQQEHVPTYDVEVPKFSTLNNVYQVEIVEPKANVGFWDLKPGTTKCGKGIILDNLRQKSDRVCQLLSSGSVTLEQAMRDLPPAAMGTRHQSFGRGVVMVDKIRFFGMALIGQPLTRALEKCVWYACGDRAHRLSQFKDFLDGKTDVIADGDDLIIRLKDGTIVQIDYSAYESSFRRKDHIYSLKRIYRAMSNRTPYNIVRVNDLMYWSMCSNNFAGGIGMIERHAGQGVDSGSIFTHTSETIVNKAVAEDVISRFPRISSSEEMVSIFRKYGREIKTSALIKSERYPVLAKLWSDGTSITGSVVRALWSLACTEGPWSIPKDMTAQDWLDGRTVSILSNVVDNPGYDFLMGIIKKTGYRMRSDSKSVAKMAEEYVSSRQARRSGSGPNSMSLEKANIKRAVDDLSAW